MQRRFLIIVIIFFLSVSVPACAMIEQHWLAALTNGPVNGKQSKSNESENVTDGDKMPACEMEQNNIKDT